MRCAFAGSCNRVRMTVGGTSAYYDTNDLPALVAAAVAVAREMGFDSSCRPEQGRLLQLLAAARRGGRIGETGTGCGVGLAWLASGADSSTQIVSVERDPVRADAARELFNETHNVMILDGDWKQILSRAPFDLLVIDGGGGGKSPTEPAMDPRDALTPFGTVVIDDFTPLQAWPPTHLGRPDTARLHWLTHPDLLSTEVVLCPEMSTIIGIRKG